MGTQVGFPYLPHRVFPSRFKGRPLPLEMLRAGMGTTYIQAGSVYGPYTKEDFLAVELEAKYVRFTPPLNLYGKNSYFGS